MLERNLPHQYGAEGVASVLEILAAARFGGAITSSIQFRKGGNKLEAELANAWIHEILRRVTLHGARTNSPISER